MLDAKRSTYAMLAEEMPTNRTDETSRRAKDSKTYHSWK
jgi:hypothetical protein